MICFFFQEPAKGWSQPEVIAQVALALTTLLTLIYFLWSFRKTLSDTYYSSLDTMYFDLLKMAVERPYLLDPTSLANEAQRREYDSYAFMVWNFLETIFDRCGKNKKLCETWYPVVETENARHRQWFDRPENRGKFKERFKDFIRGNYPAVPAASQPAEARQEDASVAAEAAKPGA